jgi:hypothetical protein
MHSLALRESLELFAVLRSWDFELQSVDELVAFSLEPVLGSLSEDNASHTRFEARLPGTTVLRGFSDELGKTATTTFQIDGDLSDFSLSLEDAPGGKGSPFGAEVAKRVGDELTVYAVIRDRDGAFALDVPVSWKVTGEQTASASAAQSFSLVRRRIPASHPRR